MLMLPFLTVTVSVPNALPETVTLWFCSKMASHSARADQLPAKAPFHAQTDSRAKGVVVAKSVEDLHSDSNNINKQTALTEKG